MSTIAASHNIDAVPKPIIDKLREAIRRARMVMAVRGCLAVASVVFITLLIGMGIDASFTIFSTALRAAISCVLLTSILVSVYLFLVRPLAKTFSYTGIARIIESRHPELEERLSSAIELLSSNDADELRGSKVLIEELAKEAVGQIDLVSPQREFNYRTVRPYLITASTAVGTLLLLFAIWPSKTSQLLARIVAPFANIGNVQATDMTV
ncbi:MAG TPA: hypothetical protein VMM56_17080, partial [Planctomycetaceae bacterium]|nr:hypothetical protein [Planctomycetaceae bacterium]